ncbi:MAG TPA: heavy metal-binding domain-containing protein [Ktedonobacteraceae bacterium]|nr:heavy metal-binding domain-containing protein [Ktedonobacteraceae bacterium]
MSSQMPPPQGIDLPMHARERLSLMRGDATHRGLFTSDLSVNEFLLVRESGFEPIGLVVGSSIYHIGFQFSNWKQNMEVNVLTQAMYNARNLAMTRMEEEANALGADGIVGVRLVITSYEWGESMAEFMAIGTAIRSRNGQQYRNARGKPFTSDLSGQDFWTLLKAGYRPVGMVMGNCVYHVAHQSFGQMMRQIGQNVEYTFFTQAVYDARELAMERMQAEAANLGAQGVVGVNIVEDSRGWGSHVIEFFAVGTAIIPISAEHQIQQPALTISLNS